MLVAFVGILVTQCVTHLGGLLRSPLHCLSYYLNTARIYLYFKQFSAYQFDRHDNFPIFSPLTGCQRPLSSSGFESSSEYLATIVLDLTLAYIFQEREMCRDKLTQVTGYFAVNLTQRLR